jgi:hypothetical protein
VYFRVVGENNTPLVSARFWSANPWTLKLAPGEYDVEAASGASAPVRKHISVGSEPIDLAVP